MIEKLVKESIEYLRVNYASFMFFTERDIVWTVQKWLIERIQELGLSSDFQVFNDYPMFKGNRRGLSTDIAIVDSQNTVHSAIEFKYEPSHCRRDIPKSKFNVVSWGADGVLNDVERISRMIAEQKAIYALVVFIDEGSYFSHRSPYEGSTWHSWGSGVSVLVAESRRIVSGELKV